jgi:predicted RNA methylase
MTEPYYRDEKNGIVLFLGDALEILPTLEAGSVDAVVTDPPYGCDKAEWDSRFFADWYPFAKLLNVPIYTITGSQGLPDAIAMVGADFVDCIAARNLNGMTRGPLGFGNWLSCVVSNGKPRQGCNAFDFVIRGDMPGHPSPKPIEYMLKLIARVSEAGDVVCDPMAGSATTGVACLSTGRRFIGIEIEERYCEIAANRLRAERERFPLFEPKELRQKELI